MGTTKALAMQARFELNSVICQCCDKGLVASWAVWDEVGFGKGLGMMFAIARVYSCRMCMHDSEAEMMYMGADGAYQAWTAREYHAHTHAHVMPHVASAQDE